MKDYKLVIFGTGQIAEVAYEYFKYDSEYDVVAFTLDESFIESETKEGLPVVPFERVERFFPPDDYQMFIAISYRDMNNLRAQKFFEAKRKGYKMATYVSSHAFVWRNVKIGEGSFIFENNVLQPFVTVGNNTIIWSGNHIGHHSKIGNHCFITSHVVISGNVEVGDYTFIGVNATIANNVKIGERNFIGAAALISRNTKPNSTYVVRPTKPIDLPPERFLR